MASLIKKALYTTEVVWTSISVHIYCTYNFVQKFYMKRIQIIVQGAYTFKTDFICYLYKGRFQN